VAQSSLRAFVRSRGRDILLFLGAAGGLAVAVQATVPMIAMAIQRRFSADLGEIGHALGLITLVTSLGSLPLAGLFDRTLRDRMGARARPIVMAVTTALAMPCALAIGFAQTEYGTLAFVAAFVLMTCIANALIPTMLQDLVPADLRARGFAIYSFLIAAFCAVGPVVSGGISQYLLADNLLGAIAIAAVPALGIALLSASLSGRR
jgi:MFS family permease